MIKRLLVLAIVAFALLAAKPTGVAAQLLVNADNGISERVPSRSGRLRNDEFGFLWEGELPLSTTSFGVVGTCQRADAFGSFVGSNKAVFRNVSLVGVDSLIQVDLVKKSVRLRNGLPRRLAIWDITSTVRNLFASDSVVLVVGEVKMTQTANFGDLVICGLAVVEADESLVAEGASQQERLRAIEELAKMTAFRHLEPTERSTE